MAIFSRNDSVKVELRGMVSREVVDILDALVQANPGTSRFDYIEPILEKWAEKKVHESKIVLRMAKSNGSDAE